MKVSCRRCGAGVPLLDARRVRCLYCLSDAELPAGVRETVGVSSSLAAETAAAVDRLRERRTEVRWQAAYVVGLALAYLVPLCYVAYVTYRAIVEGDPHYAFQVGFWGVGLYTVVFFAFAAVALRWRSASVYDLAKLRPAELEIGDALTPLCAGCGARLPAKDDDVTSTCQHCGSESLLPATLVAERLQWKHTQIMNVRAERYAMGKRQERGGLAGSRIVGRGLVWMGLAYLVLNPAWNLWLFPAKTVDSFGLMTGTLVFAGMMLFIGVITVRNSGG